MSKAHLAIISLIMVVVLGAGLLLGVFLPRLAGFMGSKRTLNTSTIINQIETLNQLVTVKYVLEKIVVMEDVKWYGENRLLLVAHGIVKAGVDLQKLKPADLRIEERKISIDLPPAFVTDVYLDDRKTQVIEHSTGLLRGFDKDLEQNARRQAVDELRSGARRGGILNDANERARMQLTLLFHQLGFESVEIKTN